MIIGPAILYKGNSQLAGEVTLLDEEYVGSGGIEFGGAASATFTISGQYEYQASGGILFGGLGTPEFTDIDDFEYEASGGIVFGGNGLESGPGGGGGRRWLGVSIRSTTKRGGK